MRAITITGFVLLLAGCAGNDLATSATVRDPEYACNNAVSDPYPFFRIVYYPNGVTNAADTTARIANRYLEPHRSADTVRTVTNQGGDLFIIFGPTSLDATYCVTVYDSLSHHLPNARASFPVS